MASRQRGESAGEGGGRGRWILLTVTCAYIAWSLAPVIFGARVSVSESSSATHQQGWTLDAFRKALAAEKLRQAFRNSFLLAGLTVALATPMGTAMALGLHHIRGRRSLATSGILVLSIGIPQVVIAASLFFLFAHVMPIVRLSFGAQALAHITLAIPFVVIVIGARLSMLQSHLEESAMDLGAAPRGVIRRVLLPLLVPAIIAAAVVAFALSFSNLVLSDLLCIPQSCRTVPTLLYGARGAFNDPAPRIYALGMLSTLVMLACGLLALVFAGGWKILRR